MGASSPRCWEGKMPAGRMAQRVAEKMPSATLSFFPPGPLHQSAPRCRATGRAASNQDGGHPFILSSPPPHGPLCLSALRGGLLRNDCRIRTLQCDHPWKLVSTSPNLGRPLTMWIQATFCSNSALTTWISNFIAKKRSAQNTGDAHASFYACLLL